MKNKCFEEFCTGCGLCEAVEKSNLKKNEKGFLYPYNYDKAFLQKVCPVSGNQFAWMDNNNIWGKNEQVYISWSTDANIRNIGSSGGVLTEIAQFLLSQKLVDGIIQTRASDNPIETITIISRTNEEIRACAGSRYTISHPLQILKKLCNQERYALIGRPCDIIAIKNYSSINPEIKKQIKYTLSFFCAGLPSDDAQKALIDRLGCASNKIVSLRYRGNGWPGFTTVVDDTGANYTMTYSESWGKILGRDLMPYCRFCIDGLGEAADISCGDAWYIGEDGYPDFTEHKGRNVVFCRTSEGLELFNKVVANNKLYAEQFDEYKDYLAKIQYAQKERRETMLAKMLSMKVLLRETPQYSLSRLYKYFKNSSMKRSFQVFKGTIKRVIHGKI